MLTLYLVVFFLIALLFSVTSVSAEVPKAIQEILKKDHLGVSFRLDDMAQVKSDLWLLIKPRNEMNLSNADELTLITKTDDEDYLFSNAWIYTRVKDNTIKSYDYYPEIFQNILIQSTIHQSFLVPDGFVLPRDLAMLAGRLPLDLGSVELATDREILYKERLKEEAKHGDLEFLAYTVKDGSFNLVKINKAEDDSLADVVLEPSESLSMTVSYASKIKKIDKDVYISDQILGKIFLLKKGVEQEFDAARPLENNEIKLEKEILELETFVDLSTYTENTGIRDFEFNKGRTNAYILTSIDSKLHIIDIRNKLLIKTIDLPASVDGMKLVSRSVSEPDKIIFRSRSGAKIYTVNTFDYRVSTTLDLDEMNETYRFIPNDLLVTEEHILVATQAIYRSPKLPKDPMGKILALDSVTGKLVSSIDLSFVPYSLAFSADKKTFFAVGSNMLSKTLISKIDTKDLKVLASADLSPDIIDAKNISSSSAGGFMLVPSSASNQVGVIDLETCTLIKKLDLGVTTSTLLAL